MFANRLFASIHLCALVIRVNKSLNFKEVSEIVPAPGAHRLPSFLILLERISFQSNENHVPTALFLLPSAEKEFR